ADKKKSKFKSVHISDNKDLSQKVGGVLETKKEQVSKILLSSSLSPIILQDSEDALEVFKNSQNGMEKAVAKGRALE
ncbi:5917_t:CDS:1, partial [Funneliformis geosporum]